MRRDDWCLLLADHTGQHSTSTVTSIARSLGLPFCRRRFPLGRCKSILGQVWWPERGMPSSLQLMCRFSSRQPRGTWNQAAIEQQQHGPAMRQDSRKTCSKASRCTSTNAGSTMTLHCQQRPTRSQQQAREPGQIRTFILPAMLRV